jgi:hypothetical protein
LPTYPNNNCSAWSMPFFLTFRKFSIRASMVITCQGSPHREQFLTT